ncbi:MAG: biopolymer transporter ExbD [Gammaproteobacteria bacterium]|nr:biopolymer transporter ExbD [Gammaproteobacteria bacterium]
MRRHGFKRQENDDSDIDMTPMLDVVFIMLIFFIVTASFVKEAGLEMSGKSDQDAPPSNDPDKASILIRIEETGRIWVDETPTDVGGVKPNVKRLTAQRPEAKVIIQAHPKSKTDVMMRVLDQSRAAGADAQVQELYVE